MTFIPKPHEIYKHFKGNLYQVVTIAEHSETGEQLVIYQALYGDFKTYARPLAMFTGEVDRQRYPEVTQRFRFELQGAEADRQIRETEAAGVEHPVSTQTTVTASQPAAAQATPIVAQNIAAQATATTAQTTIAPVSPAEDEEPALDPLVLEFLDADSYEEKLNILAGLHHRITNEMITTMAISCDIEVNDGEPEERYEELKNCLLTMEKFECNRLR
ncbi:DUF1653 domain-containing protein [Waltera sp.]|uniref:DUF1653 domain-containing protein n=1 Tax=Waltera sp. TaxID=2815806 RepID=UPI003AA83677